MERLEALLCRGRSSGRLNDKDHKYILLTNGIADPQSFSWIRDVQWYMIADFELEGESGDGESEDDLLDFFTRNKIMYPSCCTGQELTKLLSKQSSAASTEDCLKDLRIGEKVLFLQCGSRKEDTPAWFKDVMPGVSFLLTQLLDPHRLDTMENIVVITLIANNVRLKEMSLVMQKMAEVVNLDQFICLFEYEHRMRQIDVKVEEVFGASWRKQRIQITWAQLNKFMTDKTKKVVFSGLEVPGSTGAKVPISAEFLARHKRDGVCVLACNQCEEIHKMTTRERAEYCQEGKRKTLEFLAGREPDWSVFFSNLQNAPAVKDMPPGVVKREITSHIIRELRKLARSDEKCVARLCVSHYPGSGATTIGRSVLWEFKEEMRCLMLDGNDYQNGGGDSIDLDKLNRTAKRVLELRAYQEYDDIVKGHNKGLSCPPVLVLFDNCNDIMAQLLTTNLEKQVEHGGITFKETMILLLYLKSSFDVENVLRESQDLGGGARKMPPNVTIEQALTEREKKTFEARLEYLKSKHFQPQDMLSFVIMAENFDEESDYVKRLVHNALTHMELIYSNQMRVLLYLSILKYFGNAHLPVHHCKKLAFPFGLDASVKSTKGKDIPEGLTS